jgi:hypothetical protein
VRFASPFKKEKARFEETGFNIEILAERQGEYNSFSLRRD